MSVRQPLQSLSRRLPRRLYHGEAARERRGGRRGAALLWGLLCALGLVAAAGGWTSAAAQQVAQEGAFTPAIERQVRLAVAEGRPWDALAVLSPLSEQHPDDLGLSRELVKVLEKMGANAYAIWLINRHYVMSGERGSYELEAWVKRLKYQNEAAQLTRDRYEARLQVGIGLSSRDPAQAWTALEEVANVLPVLGEQTLDMLIRQYEVLGYSDKAQDLAYRATLLPTDPVQREAARKRVSEVGSRAVRANEVLSRVQMPGGEFKLGTTKREWRQAGKREMDSDEQPAHKVVLRPYALGSHEVTAQAYRRCQIEGACPPPRHAVEIVDPLQPISGISWDGAAAYCRAVGGRLPTEAEWEAAARGVERRQWPWGDDAPSCNRSHLLGCELVSGGHTFGRQAAPVGTHPAGASPEGLQDMAGNVAEWVQDGYAADAYDDLDKTNPLGPDDADLRVTRGGSYDRKARELRGARREARVPTRGYSEVGVRCAWDAP